MWFSLLRLVKQNLDSYKKINKKFEVSIVQLLRFVGKNVLKRTIGKFKNQYI